MVPGQDPDLRAPAPLAASLREVSIQLQPQTAGSRKSSSFLVRWDGRLRQSFLLVWMEITTRNPVYFTTCFVNASGTAPRVMQSSRAWCLGAFVARHLHAPEQVSSVCLVPDTHLHLHLRPVFCLFCWTFDAAGPFVCDLPARADGQDAYPPGENGGGGAARGGVGIGVRGSFSSQRGCTGHVSGICNPRWKGSVIVIVILSLASHVGVVGLSTASYNRDDESYHQYDFCANLSSHKLMPQVLISAAVGTASTQKNVIDLWWNTTFLSTDGELQTVLSSPGHVPCVTRSL